MLVVADEDHRVLRVVPDAARPFDRAQVGTYELPGAPAQVAAWGTTVLVTIRDPGLLVRLELTGGALVETGRAKLAGDAWGLAVSADGKRALVTSAWTHTLSAVDVGALGAGGDVAPLFAIELAREPRGIALDGDTAWVSHLVGADVTRVDGALGTSPTVKRVRLDAAPLRAPSGKRLGASLGYALALSEDGSRLFAARHALGALGREAWFGAASVDVLATKSETTLAPIHQGNAMTYRSSTAKEIETPETMANVPAQPLAPFNAPRDLRLRKRTRSVLVLGEGDANLVELDALALDPTLSVMHTYALGGAPDAFLGFPTRCSAPAGLALSEDESRAYVFCRGSYDLVVVPLLEAPERGGDAASPTFVSVADDPLGAEGNKGRRIFYDATDKITSGGLACAGCHPEGRDDGFVWHEASFDTPDGTNTNFTGTYENIPDLAKTKGVPRRTLMLVGHVAADGPYGWRAESKTLADRISAGMGLHRWGGLPQHAPENRVARAGHLIGFLRAGLVPPPAPPPSPLAERGRLIFEREDVGCAVCHRPQTSFTDRVAYPLKALPTRPGFDDDAAGAGYKTPSLVHLAGRPPYFHDGSAPSLERMMAENGDRMGKTQRLSEQDRAALVAYLNTL